MNFLFTITAHGFEKAAQLEKSLKDLGIPYEVVQKSPAGLSKKKRMVITKVEVLAVQNCFDKHPDWTIAAVSRETNVSQAVVSRIKQGTHPLQKISNVSNIKKAQKK